MRGSITKCFVSVFVPCVRVCVCLCVRVCMRVGLVQTATSANTLWKTNSVGVDGVSRQRSSSDLPAVHPPLPPLRVTSTSTFFFFFPPFSFLASGPYESGKKRGHCWQPLGGDSYGLLTDKSQKLPSWPQPLLLPPQIPPIYFLTPRPRWLTGLCLTRHFNNIPLPLTHNILPAPLAV